MKSSHPVFIGGIVAALALGALAGCGGGGGGGGSGPTSAPPPTTYTIGGSVSGLTGSGLVLQDNGGDNLAVPQNGSFTFAKALSAGTTYAVTVATQPSGQTCTVTNGSGTANANITNVAVTCAAGAGTYTIGGSVTGLTGTGLVLQDNGGDDLPVSTNGGFTFKTALASGAAYAVTVKTQPSSPPQTCTVNSGTGSASANVTSVSIVCAGAVAKAVYTANNGDGTLSAFTVNGTTGALTLANTTNLGAGTQPAAVSLAPNGKFAFSAYSAGTKIAAFTVDQTTGALTAVSGSPFSTGFTTGSTFPDIAVDPTSHYLYLASAADAEVAGFAIDQTTGQLSKLTGSPYPAGKGAAGIPAFSPDGKFLYVVNQGDATVSGYAIGSTGALTTVGAAVAAGSATTVAASQMWIAFTPDGKYAYVDGNGDGTNAIWCYSVGSNGVLTPLTSGNPVTPGLNPRDITVAPSGKFLYVPNYGDSNISAFAIGSDGKLTAVTGSPFNTGPSPMFVDIEPTGKYAYVSSSTGSGVYAYTIGSSGALTPISGSPFATGSKPLFAIADASGKFLYTANNGSNSISGFTIEANTGALTPIAGTFTTGAQPFVVSINPEAPGIRD